MKTESEILDMLSASSKDLEKALGLKIRNGQASMAIRKALTWVMR